MAAASANAVDRLLQRAADGDVEGLRVLLQTAAGAGVTVASANRRGWTALHMAARYGASNARTGQGGERSN